VGCLDTDPHALEKYLYGFTIHSKLEIEEKNKNIRSVRPELFRLLQKLSVTEESKNSFRDRSAPISHGSGFGFWSYFRLELTFIVKLDPISHGFGFGFWSYFTLELTFIVKLVLFTCSWTCR
jgi:hypothetical protein